MRIRCAWEHNGGDTLLYAVDHAGAYARGASLEAALSKMKGEMEAWCRWSGIPCEDHPEAEVVQEKTSDLQIADADSDILLDAEKEPLSRDEYEALKALAMKSARDFHALYASVPDKHESALPARKTFYGDVPRTAQEMYEHTKNVNSYYFGEIGIEADHDGTICECRERGFAQLEKTEKFLDNPVVEGSYGEYWSLRKVLRRFIWHDRIHARAMYRMAVRTFGSDQVQNPFCFPD